MAKPDLNVSLILKPGSHTLNSSSILSGFNQFSVRSKGNGVSSARAVINCEPLSNLHFHSIARVLIRGVIFNGCMESEVNLVEKVAIEECSFSGNADRRALVVTNSTVIILNSSFTAFQTRREPQSKLNGGAIYSSQSAILLISNSIFTENNASKGGAIYCLESALLIWNSTFARNGAYKGGAVFFEHKQRSKAVYSIKLLILQPYLVFWEGYNVERILYGLTSGGVFLCTECTFTENYAKSTGGAFCSSCDYNCEVYLEKTLFSSNNAIYGGVLMTNTSNAKFDDCIFERNEARIFGGAGYLKGKSTIHFVKSAFINNKAWLLSSRKKSHAGALYIIDFTNTTVNNVKFHGNSAKDFGGCIYARGSSIVVLAGATTFEHNSARIGGVMNV